MKLDKDLYQQASQWYQQWNEDEVRYKINHAGRVPWQKRWQEFLDLWEFAITLNPHPSLFQRIQKLQAMDDYLKRIEKMESWRKARGR